METQSLAENIAVIGAGELGRRIAFAAARAGYRVILEDISPERREQGIAEFARVLDDEVAREKRADSWRNLVFARLRTASSVEDACRTADFILETAADEEELKLELFTLFDKFAKPAAILATTAQSISINDLAGITFCPDRCVGLRFSPDAGNVTGAQIVKGRATSEETVRRCREFAQHLDLQVSVVENIQPKSVTAAD